MLFIRLLKLYSLWSWLMSEQKTEIILFAHFKNVFNVYLHLKLNNFENHLRYLTL